MCYKQTVIGAAWAILQPFITMVVFTVVFGRLDRMSPEGLPYPLFAFSALVPWTYFTHALTTASNSVVVHRTLITKVYFPRVVLPLAAVLGGLMDFAIAFSMLLGMLLFYGIIPTAAVWTLPFFLFLMTATALGVGLWLAALHVQYRDIGNALPFLMQVWLFATPIAYPSNLIPESWRVLYSLNPMVGVVEGFRWALLGTGQAPGACLSASIVAVAGVLISGLYFFRRQEDFFADVV